MSLCRCFKILPCTFCTFCTFYKNLHETLETLETLCSLFALFRIRHNYCLFLLVFSSIFFSYFAREWCTRNKKRQLRLIVELPFYYTC